MLQVVAWGGMLFLLICNAAPAMCHPSCDDLYSARKIWIEIDSQILNALFCVTGLGLLPWRGRDTWLLYKKNWPKLSKVHSGWYIDGVTKRALMYWVVILFLMNSIWQIAVPHTPPLFPLGGGLFGDADFVLAGIDDVVFESV
jgi:hypothetical protein